MESVEGAEGGKQLLSLQARRPRGHSAKAVETDLLTGRANSAEPAVTGTRAEKVRCFKLLFYMVVLYG